MFCMETLLERAVGCWHLLLLKVEVTVPSSGVRIAERGRSFGCEPGRKGQQSAPANTFTTATCHDEDIKMILTLKFAAFFFLELSPGDVSS